MNRLGAVFFGTLLLCAVFVAAHEDDPTYQCAPADPIDDTPLLITAGLVLIGAAALAGGVWLRGRKRKKIRLTLLVGGGLAICAAVVYGVLALELNADTIHFGWPGSAHKHADFQVMVNDQLVDFTNDYYYTYKGHERSRYAHLHDPDYVVHVHADGVTWAYFWKTLNVTMNDSCIAVHGEPICNATYIRNGEVVPNLLAQPIEEGDRVLFHFGTGDAISYFPAAVGNNSCLHSGTCPDRGVLPGCAAIPATG